MDPATSFDYSIRYDISHNEQSQLCADLYAKLEGDTSLSSTEKNIFVDVFYNKEKTRDVARKYCLDTKEIAAIKTKILDKMRAHLAASYGIKSYSDVYDI